MEGCLEMKVKIKDDRKLSILGYMGLIVASIIVLIPVLWMFSTSLKEYSETMSIPPHWIPKHLTFDAYISLCTEYPFFNYFKNSIFVVVISVILTLVCASLAGYGVTRFKFKGKKLFISFLLMTQMFPSVMLVVPYYKLLKNYGLNNSLFGLTLVYTSVTIAFCTWLMIGYYKTIPLELDEAARIDGCNSFQTFIRVILPLTQSGMITTCIYCFISSWNDYMFAQTLLKDPNLKTISLGIADFNGFYKIEYNSLMAASVIACIPVLIVFLCLQKHFVSGITAGAVK